MSDEPVEISYDASDSPTLCDFLACDDFARMLVGPFGSGKSSCSIAEILKRSIQMPRARDGLRHSRWVIIRNTYRELEDTTRKTFEEWVKPDLGTWRGQDFAFDMKFDDVRAEVLFRALDRPDDVKKLLSLEITGAYLNEAREIPRVIWDTVQGRCGRFPARKNMRTPKNPSGLFWYGIWGDTNPPDTDHWIFKIFEEERPDEIFTVEDPETGEPTTIRRKFSLFHQPAGDGPDAENLKHLPLGYYQTLKVGKNDDWVNVNVKSQYGFVKSGKPIYPEYNDSIHCAPAIVPVPGWEILLGQDFGLTPAAVLAQRDPSDGQLQVFDELVSDDMGAARFFAELARTIKASYPDRLVRGFGDPAGEQRAQTDERTPFDFARGAGLPLFPAPTNDFTRRREAVAGMLSRLTLKGRPALVISPRAAKLRKAMAGKYCLERLQVAGEDRFRDAPLKNEWSHVAEALQYLCVGEGEDHRAINAGKPQRKVKFQFKVHRSIRGLHG